MSALIPSKVVLPAILSQHLVFFTVPITSQHDIVEQLFLLLPLNCALPEGKHLVYLLH